MQMINSIQVPLDGSKFAEHALPLAMSIAAESQAVLELLHVCEPPSYAGFEKDESLDVDPVVKTRSEEYLNGVAEQIRAVSTISVGIKLLKGRPANQLLSHFSLSSVDLVVLSTHGRGLLSRYWFGSVADELIRSADVPLLLVRPRENDPDLKLQPAVAKMLITLDGSERSEEILGPAVKLGQMACCDYQLLQVVPPEYSSGPDPWFSGPIEVPNAAKLTQARQYLQEIANRIQTNAKQAQVEVDALTSSNTAQTILEHAELTDSGMIALQTHGRSGLSRLYLGSVADKVIRGAEVPVLLNRRTSELHSEISESKYNSTKVAC